MKNSVLLSLVPVLLASHVCAQNFERKPGDSLANEGAFKGQTHEFFDGGRSFFSISGTYTYTYPDGGVAYGSYTLPAPGLVCTAFRHGFERCDQYVTNEGRLILITQDGDRFPVRHVSP